MRQKRECSATVCVTRIRIRCTHVREQQACVRECTCALRWCMIRLAATGCAGVRTRARVRTRASIAQRVQRIISVSSMMAHISFCLQHKLRSGTRAVKCFVRATRSRYPCPVSYSLSLPMVLSVVTAAKRDTLLYSSRKPRCFRGQPRRGDSAGFLGRTAGNCVRVHVTSRGAAIVRNVFVCIVSCLVVTTDIHIGV